MPRRRSRKFVAVAIPFAGLLGLAAQSPALADGHGPQSHTPIVPGDLLVSTSVFADNPAIVAGTTQLPPGCARANCVTAIANGTYPQVFNNDSVDSSFGVTSNIVLQELTKHGSKVGTIDVPNASTSTGGGVVTSFSSKSELALNLSTSGDAISFMGYAAPVGALDVSNSNTPGAIDPTNPVPGSTYRVVSSMDRQGHFNFTETNAYSGNNGRAAILNDANGTSTVYTAGNAGNGSNPQPSGVVLGAGTQLLTPSALPESSQSPGVPTPVGSFSITQLGLKADKIGKDDNFRGLTISDNVVYLTKGSGGNGIDTVYFIDPTGTACPSGVGVPVAGAPLPTATLTYNATTGLAPNNMCILKGFPTELAKTSTTSFPFGIWFANPHTLFVADEGDGANTYDTTSSTYTVAASSTTAGLQKWTFDATTGSWVHDYTIQGGLDLGTPYTVAGFPIGNNPVTGLPWSPATDGLRNVTGRVDRLGRATIWAVTSTVSGNGDQGADPNKLVTVRDALDATSLPAGEAFSTVETAQNRSVLRGVSFTPGTSTDGRANGHGHGEAHGQD